jgi:phosphopantothenoylcysteine synthetase/decarboxylase
MNEPYRQESAILYVVTCAARSAEPMDIQDFVKLAQASFWDVYIIATPQATKFIDQPLLEKLTGHLVRCEYRHPEEPDTFPKADAIVVAPATFNTINKWASGITNTLALGILCEHMGLGTPIVTVPCVPESLAYQPTFSKNIVLLKSYEVSVLYEPCRYPPMNNVPWELVLFSLNKAIAERACAKQEEEVY